MKGDLSLQENTFWMWTLLALGLLIFLYFEPRLVTIPWHITRMADTWVWSKLAFMLPESVGATMEEVHQNFRTSPIGSADYAAFWRVEQMLYPFPSVLYGLVVVLMGLMMYRKNRFNKAHTMESLLKQETEVWRFSRLFVKHNPSKNLDLTKGDWAVRLKPIQFIAKYHLAKKDPAVGEYFDYPTAEKVMQKQLGKRFTGYDDMTDPERWVMAVLLLKVNEQKDRWDTLKGDMGACYAGEFSKKDVNSEVAKVLKEYGDSKYAQEAKKRHAYVFTMLAYMMSLHYGGKMSTSFIPWVKLESRRLYYVLNDVGRQTASAEAAAIRAHLLAEKAAGKGLDEPCIRKAVDSLKAAFDDYLKHKRSKGR
ncbi:MULTISPECIES: hypothetical protein [unclassified Thioalkalivibrio]|uniref:secretion/conjugation apparatus DotM-related subunit n=1 Tax=unclassified Thioalkalivibrio TaxID=2621013 RepID=UPI0003768171|nr:MULTISPECIES: hypothetical protein [unclassified Thioalkalivibrio]